MKDLRSSDENEIEKYVWIVIHPSQRAHVELSKDGSLDAAVDVVHGVTAGHYERAAFGLDILRP